MSSVQKNNRYDFSESNFIIRQIDEDLKEGKCDKISTRFPPEPNGYLHLGHAKSIFLNFAIAQKYNGECRLRFDDTNPVNENDTYIKSIIEDVKWLGCDLKDNISYASDYFVELYGMALELISNGLAYVDEQTEEEIQKNRGDINTPGIDSPFRNRTVEENHVCFNNMKNGKYNEGEAVLRAKIDMKSGNINLRDPILYRVRFHDHPRTQNVWCIYPLYDFAHGQCDSLEKISHSLCTLEFENHRPLYDWFQTNLKITKSSQIEFSRLECTYTVLSKRKLLTLVENKYVNGWDDPRLPTLSGLRRRGYPPEAIIDFCKGIGIAKRDVIVRSSLLNCCAETFLNSVAYRTNVILNPIVVEITNLKPNEKLKCIFPNIPNNPDCGSRELTFSSRIYIDRLDFCIRPIAKFHRLSPGKEVRLRHGYWIKCTDVKLDEYGEIDTVYCTYDPTTANGNAPSDGRKVKSTIQWISEDDKANIKVLLYDHLLTISDFTDVPTEHNWLNFVNDSSIKKVNALGEKSLIHAKHPYQGGLYYQFERIGYFVADYSSSKDDPIFNSTLLMKDSWGAEVDENNKEAQNKKNDKLAREKAQKLRQEKKNAKLLKNMNENTV